MGLNVSWKVPKLKREVTDSDKNFFKGFKEFMNNVSTRQVLFEKIAKPKVTQYGYEINSETVLLRNYRINKIKSLVNIVPDNGLDRMFGSITPNLTYNRDKITTEDLEHIYDMFA